MNFVIAVDGPAASGKGTVAARLAEAYALPYLDTGLLYRAVGHGAAVATAPTQVLEDGYGVIDADSAEFARAAVVLAHTLPEGALEDRRLRTNAASELASRVASIAAVREGLLDFQRGFAEQAGGAVIDGRDIGTVIAPTAPCKLFVTAAPQIRAERRWKQLLAQGERVSLADILADIHRRDARDSGREAAPLAQAPDAVLLDTSDLTISQSVEAARRIVEAARSRWEVSRSG